MVQDKSNSRWASRWTEQLQGCPCKGPGPKKDNTEGESYLDHQNVSCKNPREIAASAQCFLPTHLVGANVYLRNEPHTGGVSSPLDVEVNKVEWAKDVFKIQIQTTRIKMMVLVHLTIKGKSESLISAKALHCFLFLFLISVSLKLYLGFCSMKESGDSEILNIPLTVPKTAGLLSGWEGNDGWDDFVWSFAMEKGQCCENLNAGDIPHTIYWISASWHANNIVAWPDSL